MTYDQDSTYVHPSQIRYGHIEPRRSNGFAISGLVLGIISLFSWWLGIIALAIWVCAVTFGIMGIRNHGTPNAGMGIAGLILGAIGGILYLVFALATAGVGFFV